MSNKFSIIHISDKVRSKIKWEGVCKRVLTSTVAVGYPAFTSQRERFS